MATETAISNGDVVTYCNCMEEVKQRMGLVLSVLDRSTTTDNETFDTELVFVQLRKTLELIAFASLTANKMEYSAAYTNFAGHWNARKMLAYLQEVNPNFYPVPLELPVTLANGHKHCEQVTDGFLTKEDFVLLYQTCGKVLHARNPFTKEDPVIKIGYSVEQWVSRIQRLLMFHSAHLLCGDIWVVNIPTDGKVHAWPASPAT